MKNVIVVFTMGNGTKGSSHRVVIPKDFTVSEKDAIGMATEALAEKLGLDISNIEDMFVVELVQYVEGLVVFSDSWDNG